MSETSGTTIIIYLIIAIVALVVIYYLIKSAVKNAIIESRQTITHTHENRINNEKYVPSQDPYSPAQLELMRRYEKGEIKMDEYKSEWNKLK